MTESRTHSEPSRKLEELEQEIAELREESYRLLERAARYRNFVEFSSEGIWCFAFEPPISTSQPEDEIIRQAIERGVMVECNDALARMYGHERADDLLGTRLSDFMSPAKTENIEYLRAFVRSGFRLEDGESREVDREGRPKSFLNNLVGIIEEGELRQAWGTQRDISERKQLEEQLRQAQKMDAIGQIAGGIAHDFNNMLTVISGALELLQDDGFAGERLAAPLRDASHAVAQATGLTRQLLAFSRRHVVQLGAIDLNQTVADAARMMRRVIPESIELETRLTPGLPLVRADHVELDQALVNLIINARDAIEGSGRIVVETSLASEGEEGPAAGTAGRTVALRVSDTGCGMAPDTVERIFDPFFTTKEAVAGTGLGLSMVYAAVARSGGAIWVESHPGRGSVFHVRMPVADSSASVDASDEPRVESRGVRATVLLVEDQPNVRRLVRRLLESAGHSVLEASGADQARAIARQEHEIDLLLSDVVMPGQNGLELARALKRELPHLRVLLMTGYADLPDELGQKLLREARLLAKPFTRAQLEQEVQAALSGRESDEAVTRGR